MNGTERLSYEEWAQISLYPDVELVAPAIERFRDSLVRDGASPASLDGILLAVTEAVTNSMKHGRPSSEQTDVRLRWMWQAEVLDVQVSEPGEFTPTPNWTELPEDPLVESGRGGFLMAQHFEQLEHTNSNGRHVLRMRTRLARNRTVSSATELEQTLTAMTEDLSTSYETLSALFKLAEALATTETLPDFAVHAQQLRSLVEADTMHVRLQNETGHLVLIGQTNDQLPIDSEVPTTSPGIEAEVFRTGHERTIDNLAALPPTDPLHRLNGVGFVCPVYFQSKYLGVCVVTRRTPGRFFTAAQIALARTTAEFLGIACANAELQTQRLAQLRVQRELEIAAQIQQSLVPVNLPRRADWRVHGRCINALEAGGDFFDVVDMPSGILLVIADVMGKGVPAALLAVVLRTALRAHTSLATDPGALLNCVSVELAPDLERVGMFITAQVAFLETGSGRLSYANAGHCPFVVLGPGSRTSRVLDHGGLPLGVSQHENYTAETIVLSAQERMLLLTDGVVESPNEQGVQLGLDGFISAAMSLHDPDLGSTCSNLLALLDRRDGGRPPTDDRTLLIVECLA